MSSPQAFEIQDARDALNDILKAFTSQDNESSMRSAREKAGNDMLKFMQYVFPVATQIQLNVIPKYGFPSDGEGIIRFSQMIKLYEKQDSEVMRLNSELRGIVMPRMPLTTDNTRTTNSTTNVTPNDVSRDAVLS